MLEHLPTCTGMWCDTACPVFRKMELDNRARGMPKKMSESKETIEFSAKVPSEAYDEFREYVPAYGGTSWFINAALLEFNRRMRDNPDQLKKVVKDSVEAMLQLNRTLKEASA